MIESGTKLGRYEVRALIGAGGMGEVYLAHDPKIDRDVAVKVLPPAFSTDKDRLARFEQEAQAAGALNHPNVLAIYDVDTHDGSPYVVSELLEGDTLREAMNGTPLPIRKAINWAQQAAHGLAAAHEKGIIHRDLKPENLFLTSDGRVKILDFGLAKLTETNGDLARTDLPTRRVNTDSGAIMGTVGYMSPEQLRGKQVDPRTDIFSFGTVLYEMLSGQKAFQRDSTADTISAILREDPPELSDTNREVNPGLERVVRRCLEKNREQRFHSASDLAFALESLTSVSASGETTQVISQESTSPQPRRSSADRFGWIAAAVLLVPLLGLAYLYFRHADPPARTMRFVVPVPENANYGDGLAISPDGRQIAFVASGNSGDPSLWVRALDSLESRQLTGTEGAAFPFWSPDGRSIGFFAGNKLKKIDASGGPAQSLADASADPRGGTWAKDGTILFSPNVTMPIYKVPSSGGPVTPVTTVDEAAGLTSHRWPTLLPDGRHFLYFARANRNEIEGIYAGSLDSPETKFVLQTRVRALYAPSASGKGYLLFVRDGSLMAQPFDASKLELSGESVPIAQGVLSYPTEVGPTAYSVISVSDNGQLIYRTGTEQVTQMFWFDRSGKSQEAASQPGIYHEPQLSPDGKRILLGKQDSSTTDVYLIDPARGSTTRLTFDAASDASPVWSPDGSQIVFCSNRNNNFKMYRKLSSGAGGDELIYDARTNAFPDDWSRDGRFVVFELDGGVKRRSDLWLFPMSGDPTPVPYLQTPFSETHARFSPDGRWIAYVSDESGRPEVYVQSVPATGGKWQVSTGGGDQPQWRGDGKELYYIAADRNLMAVAVSTASTFEAAQPAVLFQTRVPITTLTDDRNNYSGTADGQKFLVNNLVEQNNSTPITFVLNWDSGLIH